MTEFKLGLTVPVDANRDIMELAIARIAPHGSEPEPETQKLYIWETEGATLAIGISPDRPSICLGDYVYRLRLPNDWYHRYGLVVGFKPNQEFCVLMVEQGKAGIQEVPLVEVVSAATAWHQSNREMLDPKPPISS